MNIRIANNISIVLEGGTLPRFKNLTEGKKHLQIRPYAQVEQRLYTRIIYREPEIDHSLDLRGEYTGLRSHSGFGDRSTHPWQTIGPVLGQICNLGKKGVLSGSIGYSIHHSNQKIGGTSLNDFELGLAF